MKTIKESILTSTRSGKDIFEPRLTTNSRHIAYYNVDCPMKEWFKAIDAKTFLKTIKNGIYNLRKDYSEGYISTAMTCITFKDGVFGIYFSNNNMREILFNFYFAEELEKHPDYKALLAKQRNAIDGMGKVNYFKKGLSVEKCAAQLLEFIKNNLDKIIKQ